LKTKPKTLITGGAGFIGSHLVERVVREGHEVIVLDNLSCGSLDNLKSVSRDISFFKEDISDLKSILGYFKEVDLVFHLAALADIVPSVVNPHKYCQANIDGTIAVLEAARLNKVKKIIYAASSSCYGVTQVLPTPEDAKISPQYPYAFTKYIGEQSCFFWAKMYGLSVISLRLFNVYGLRSRTSGTYGAVLGVFLAQKLAGHPFTVVGDGNQARDFIYVSDAVEAFIKAAASDITCDVFNVGTGNPRSINNLVSLLGGENVHIPKRPGEPDCTRADITKIKKILNWQSKVSFEEGISMVLENIDYWKNAPVWTPEKIEEVTQDWFKYLG
jgi:UDP-glucose 4-epimerase